MTKFAFILVLIILVLIPPHSRVVDPPICLGVCLDGPPPDEILVPTSDDASHDEVDQNPSPPAEAACLVGVVCGSPCFFWWLLRHG